MSATNWTACPACKTRVDEKLKAAYGIMDRDDYALLLKEAESAIEETFREDYEIWGAAEGVLHMEYLGRCTDCGTKLMFQHSHAIDLPE